MSLSSLKILESKPCNSFYDPWTISLTSRRNLLEMQNCRFCCIGSEWAGWKVKAYTLWDDRGSPVQSTHPAALPFPPDTSYPSFTFCSLCLFLLHPLLPPLHLNTSFHLSKPSFGDSPSFSLKRVGGSLPYDLTAPCLCTPFSIRITCLE